MKFMYLLVSLVGIVSLILAVLTVLLHDRILGVSAQGFIRGATSLFLLSLVIAVYDRFYHGNR